MAVGFNTCEVKREALKFAKKQILNEPRPTSSQVTFEEQSTQSGFVNTAMHY